MSPDLNPIENAWAHMVNNMDVRSATSADEVWDSAEEFWRVMSENLDYWHKLIDSMPTRLGMVIAAQGDSIKY